MSLSEGRISMYRSQWESALAALNEALDILGTEERPIMAGRIRLELATALAHTADAATALDQVRNALAIFERLGARRDADKARPCSTASRPREADVMTREFEPDVEPST